VYHEAKSKFEKQYSILKNSKFTRNILSRLEEWDITRLTQSLSKLIPELEESLQPFKLKEDPRIALKTSALILIYDLLGDPVVFKNNEIDAQFQKLLKAVAGLKVKMNEFLPGVFQLSLHRNEKVRIWARKTLNYCKKIETEQEQITRISKWKRLKDFFNKKKMIYLFWSPSFFSSFGD